MAQSIEDYFSDDYLPTVELAEDSNSSAGAMMDGGENLSPPVGTITVVDAPEPYCGDGVVQEELGETCDDGNNENKDGCDKNCHGSKTCCICQYQEIMECGTLNSDEVITDFSNAEKFCPGCSFYGHKPPVKNNPPKTAKSACNRLVTPSTGYPNCEWSDEAKRCYSEFHLDCKRYIKQADFTETSKWGIGCKTSEFSFGDAMSFSDISSDYTDMSLYDMGYCDPVHTHVTRFGHANSTHCEKVEQISSACIKCLHGNCKMSLKYNGCSVFTVDTPEFGAFVKNIKNQIEADPSIEAGASLEITANQAVSSPTCSSLLKVVFVKAGSTGYVYPSCELLGAEDNYCWREGEVAYCSESPKDDIGVPMVCCPTDKPKGVFQNKWKKGYKC
jgi:cysteine-rich repeat protein